MDPATLTKRGGRFRKRHEAGETARFRVDNKNYFIKAGSYRKVTAPLAKTFLEVAARHLCGVIWAMEIELTALKDA